MSTQGEAATSRIGAFLLRMPDWAKAGGVMMAIAAAAFSVGLSAMPLWASYRELPSRVEQLQAWRAGVDSTDLAGQVADVRRHQARQDSADAEQRLVLRYLACRAIEADRGGDPRGCGERYRDPLEELLPAIAPTTTTNGRMHP